MRILTVVLLVLLPLQALAQPLPAIPPGPDKIQTLREGDPAPFSGHLYSPDTALRWANWLEQYKLRQKLDRDLQEKICLADITLRDQKLAFAEQQYQTVVTDLEKRLAAAEDPPFYQTMGFGFGVGVAATVAVVIATAVVLGAVSD